MRRAFLCEKKIVSANKVPATIAATHKGAKAETTTGKAIVAVQRYIIKVVRRCELPARIIRWCICSLSELNGDCPARNLRKIAEDKSISGIANTAKGRASGKSVGPRF